MPKKTNNSENQNYWNKRARLDKLKVIKTGEQGIDSLKRLLAVNLKSVKKQITDFYDKYGEEYKDILNYDELRKYKNKLREKARRNPQDKTLQKILKKDNLQNIKIKTIGNRHTNYAHRGDCRTAEGHL